MTRESRSLVAQSCPNCARLHDVGVYVSGQNVVCSCGIRFEVKRSDVRGPGGGVPRPEQKTLNPHAASQVGTAGPPSSVPVELDLTVASSRPSVVGEEAGATGVSSAPKVPGYELVELLGKGGMGEVWRARQLSLGRLVALKLLPSRFASDRDFVARFDKESTALAALSHPGVVQIIDRGQAGDHYYFVMELVSGINLRELMNGGRPPVRDALRIGAQVARAIDYAHEQKIVHRDLKPENILVDPRGHVKIADFGLAGMKGNERDIALTATAVAMGTVNYMAPEQRRDAKHVDHRADLYSLGVVLYELLTGELPIGRFKLPSQHVAGLDPRLDEAVGQLLESDPAARPARANDVAQVLDDAAIGASATTPGSGPRVAPVSATGLAAGALAPSTVPGRAASFVQEPGAGWKLGVFVLAGLLLLGVVLKLWPEAGDEPARPPPAPPAWYGDSEGEEVFSTRVDDGDGLKLEFEAAAEGEGEEVNLHSGTWRLEKGVLSAVQYGDAIDAERLVPRAYLAKRYFKPEGFEASVNVELEPLPADFPPQDPQHTQRFAELAFRINDLQVSVFAIPGTPMRLGWRYFTAAGQKIDGNSAVELQELTEDPVNVPPRGPFRMRLKLTPLKNGDITAEGYLNGSRFTRQVLPGLGGQVGKVALGCRNAQCRFDDLVVKGQEGARPTPKK